MNEWTLLAAITATTSLALALIVYLDRKGPRP